MGAGASAFLEGQVPSRYALVYHDALTEHSDAIGAGGSPLPLARNAGAFEVGF